MSTSKKPRRGIRVKPETPAASSNLDQPDAPTSSLSHGTDGTDGTALIGKGKSGPMTPQSSWDRWDREVLESAINPAITAPQEDDILVEAPPDVSQCPCWRCYLDWWRDGENKRAPGVYHHDREKREGDETRADKWVCGPLVVLATTFDQRGESFGRLLRFQDVRGRWHEWNMPMRLLRGTADELRGELLDLGLAISPNARDRLSHYLMHRAPQREVISALSLGWHDDTFVFPDVAIGPAEIRYQSESAAPADYDQRGTLDDWRANVAALASGNTCLTLAISAALAGPLLARVHLESCGLHFHGDSSGGKTTALQAAVSVWGSRDMLRTWRATGNGLEAAAAESTDALLALDEISEADGREIGSIVYALANGRGKSRANRSGGARRIARWRTVVLSSGEKTLEARMLEAGARHHAGQDVRLLNLPVDGHRHGTFDTIHGRDSARAFADEIKSSSARYYGRAGRAFVRFLVEHLGDDFGAMVKELTDRLPTREGQEARAARQFALIATAGELATQAGITGWEKGAATKATVSAYTRWREARGRGNAEATKILEAVRDFIERHGDTRFTRLYGADRPLRGDRAGYTETLGERLTYLFTASGLGEATQGHDRTRVLDALEAAGWLVLKPGKPPQNKGETRRLQRKIEGRVVTLYGVDVPDEGEGNERVNRHLEVVQ